jgi:hypothetical protein
MSLLDLLFQFLSRLSFGLSLVMGLAISARAVPSGFFRGHSLVLLGITVLAALIAFNQPGDRFWYLSTAAAVASYFGSVAWLYEKPRVGKCALLTVSMLSLFHAWLDAGPLETAPAYAVWPLAVVLSSGLLLGVVIGAMFLGHYYLNAPAMRLEPLRLLVAGIVLATLVRGATFALGAEAAWSARHSLVGLDWALVAMHLLAGQVGTMVLAWMAWQTLKIPNTQSATGILYVGVIFVFLGELAALVLSGKLGHPI